MTADAPPVVVQDRDGARYIVINRPSSRNALSDDVVAGVSKAIANVKATEVNAVVITGAGDVFCAGGDLKQAQEGRGLGDRTSREAGATMMRRLVDLDLPLVARVNGHALGGGLGLVAASDLAIAVDTAEFGTPEVRVGLWPMIISPLLLRELGRRRAMELMSTGKRINAATALSWGLLNRVVPEDRLDQAVDEALADLHRGAPLALRHGKRTLRAVARLDMVDALAAMVNELALLADTEDAAEGVAAFLERRTPRFKGH